MKSIRIGCGSGGCAYERIEPALELIEKGNLNYLVFECLSERTVAAAQMSKRADSAQGYNPMLEERMIRLLKPAWERDVKMISNMGAANTPAAVAKIAQIARELDIRGLKIAMLRGDDLFDRLHEFEDAVLIDRKVPLKELAGQLVSANAYLGGEGIRQALDAGAQMVITGRVADPSLFVGPILHEFGDSFDAPDKRGQAILLGHLLECCGQLTGGFYADPGYKEVPDLHRLGFPIGQIREDGLFHITKAPGSGGMISEQICREQLLYEIDDPSRYITPDGVADFNGVTFYQQEPEVVRAQGALAYPPPDTYKINVGYIDCFVGDAEISFGGRNCLARAELAADIVKKRLQLTGVQPLELRASYIGYDSLYGRAIAQRIADALPAEVRLRVSARTRTRQEAEAVVREVACLYTNGPAGASGIWTNVREVLTVDNIILPKADFPHCVEFVEV